MPFSRVRFVVLLIGQERLVGEFLPGVGSRLMGEGDCVCGLCWYGFALDGAVKRDGDSRLGDCCVL